MFPHPPEHIQILTQTQNSIVRQVAGNNGLKLPREFGLLIKQVSWENRWEVLNRGEIAWQLVVNKWLM